MVIRKRKTKKSLGQSLVEITLLFPALLIMLSGLIEFGFFLNEYLVIISATRNAARFGSDGSYFATDSVKTCSTTRDFFRQIGCLASQELRQERPFVTMNDNGTPGNFADDYIDPARGDDVIVTAISVLQSGSPTVDKRFPSNAGWSWALDHPSYGVRNHSSNFSNADIESKLDAGAPSTGFLLVEIFYSYDQTLKLPWITTIIPDPIPVHFYTFMPLSSAEPTPTPEP
jgi:hypothetical protein